VAEEPPSTQPLPSPVLLPLSAKAEPALAVAALRLATHIQANPDLDPTDVAYSLVSTRSAFEHRAVLVGGSREELLGALHGLAHGKEHAGVALGQARQEQRPTFLFPGQGAQAQGMALGLIEASPNTCRPARKHSFRTSIGL
jgi:polyketide synthase 7